MGTIYPKVKSSVELSPALPAGLYQELCELLPPQVQPTARKFGVKLVSKTADWAGFTGFAVSYHCIVNNLAFRGFHGMEEVIGSIPIRSTKQINHLEAPPPRDFVASLSQIPKLLL